jgi:hypothetical protein
MTTKKVTPDLSAFTPKPSLSNVRVYAPENDEGLRKTGLKWVPGCWFGDVSEEDFEKYVDGKYTYEFPEF